MHPHTSMSTPMLQVLYNNVLDSMWLLAPWVVWTALLTTIYVLSLIWTMSMESDLQVCGPVTTLAPILALIWTSGH